MQYLAKRRSKFAASAAFTLPMVVILATVMIAILALTVQGVSAIRKVGNNRYNQQLAREAAEAGMVMLKKCLANGIVNNSYTITPATDCQGTTTSGSSQYLTDSARYKTTFSGKYTNANNRRELKVTGKVQVYTASNTLEKEQTFVSTYQQQAAALPDPSTQTAWTDPTTNLKWSYPVYTDYSSGAVAKIANQWKWFGKTWSSCTGNACWMMWSWNGSNGSYTQQQYTSNAVGKTASQICQMSGKGWRLPTSSELVAAYNHGLRTSNAISGGTAAWSESFGFWSSNESGSNATFVYLKSGSTGTTSKSTYRHIICVRS